MKVKGKHYIEAMPDKLRQEWKENHCNILQYIEKNNFAGLRHFLYETVICAETSQGHEYWERIANDELICEKVDKLAFRSQNIEELGI